jgi:hypothetical protein
MKSAELNDRYRCWNCGEDNIPELGVDIEGLVRKTNLWVE